MVHLHVPAPAVFTTGRVSEVYRTQRVVTAIASIKWTSCKGLERICLQEGRSSGQKKSRFYWRTSKEKCMWKRETGSLTHFPPLSHFHLTLPLTEWGYSLAPSKMSHTEIKSLAVSVNTAKRYKLFTKQKQTYKLMFTTGKCGWGRDKSGVWD